jgi:hypothetical protein
MSFDLVELQRLKAAGPVWDEYQRLVAAADQAMHDSPAHAELGAFRVAWLADPAAVIKALVGVDTRAGQLAAANTAREEGN